MTKAEIINLAEYREKREKQKRAKERVMLIGKMSIEMTKDEADLTTFQLLDLFFQKYDPKVYMWFDLFINGELE